MGVGYGKTGFLQEKSTSLKRRKIRTVRIECLHKVAFWYRLSFGNRLDDL